LRGGERFRKLSFGNEEEEEEDQELELEMRSALAASSCSGNDM